MNIKPRLARSITLQEFNVPLSFKVKPQLLKPSLASVALLKSSFFTASYVIVQGPQARGPRAVCGPPDAFMRPANISKIDNIINL